MTTDKPCPYCLWPMKAAEQLIECPECAARFHDECWTDNGGCATFGCPVWMQAQQASANARAAQAQSAPPVPVPSPPPAAVATQAPPPATSNFCDQCGARTEGTVAFCASCGSRFDS